MTQVVRELPDELVRLLALSGGRRLILVEGPDDQLTLRAWYPSRLADIEFFAVGGSREVVSVLDTLSTRRPDVLAFGILDRDFRTDAEVAAWQQDPDARVFVLPRYELENYLLEPTALHEELRTYYAGALPTPSAANIEADLLRLCQQLCPVSAANWVFHEAGNVPYFKEGFPAGNRPLVVEETAKRLGCAPQDADQRLAAKEALIAPQMVSLTTAHQYIRGKLLLHEAYTFYLRQRRGLPKDSFRSYLVRAAEQRGLHPDITTIIEQRVLAAR